MRSLTLRRCRRRRGSNRSCVHVSRSAPILRDLQPMVIIMMTAQAAPAEGEGRGQTRCAREHERAAAERVRGRVRGGPAGGVATDRALSYCLIRRLT